MLPYPALPQRPPLAPRRPARLIACMRSPPLSSDVVILGAGPAGAIAALCLARAGREVLLVDKAAWPRDKICGDGLIPDSLHLLEELGLLQGVRALGHGLSGLRVTGPAGGEAQVDLPFVTARRERLDHFLVQAAVAAGARLVQGEGRACRPGEVELADGRCLNGSLTLVCTGAGTRSLAQLGLAHRTSPSALAARAYYRLAPEVPQDRLIVSFEKAVLPGYAWVFPMGDHVFNVGVGQFLGDGESLNLKAVLARYQQDSPTGRALLRGAEALTPLRGAPLRTGLSGCAPSAEGLLVAGEAIGSTYALTGEGIGKAMATGRLAARFADEALRCGRTDAQSLSAYDRALEAELRPFFAPYQAAQAWMRWPQVADLVVWRTRRSARVQRLVADILSEARPATDLFSPGGILRALLPG